MKTQFDAEVARVTSWQFCIVAGCIHEDGHIGPHDIDAAEQAWLLSLSDPE